MAEATDGQHAMTDQTGNAVAWVSFTDKRAPVCLRVAKFVFHDGLECYFDDPFWEGEIALVPETEVTKAKGEHDLLMEIANESDEAKGLMRKAGFGWSGLDLLQTTKLVLQELRLRGWEDGDGNTY